ncbi:MAG: sugar nucleotide-binding protein, partial [Rhodospirillales bacterium]|nr:sugar nucleotide-binding protein [Rhodospirillales bacterium]
MNLVVGSGGFLGRRFAESLRHRQGGVIAASHQEKSDLHLDLREDPKNLDIPRGIRYALMLSSVTSVDDCFNEPERTHTLNVVNTIKLATRFQECGVVPVFFSSDLVFRGDKGNYIEEDDTEPLTEYGKQKKIVEDMLVAEIPESIIIRLGKVYTLEDDDTSPVHGLIESLSCGKRVRAATDQVLTPTLAGEIVDSVIDLMSRGARGIYHLSPGRQGMVS